MDKQKRVSDLKKPVNPKWFSGFFMLTGLIVLFVAFYNSGRLKVPSGTAHDQMGNAVKNNSIKPCDSKVQLTPVTNKYSSQQRHLYAIKDLFPDISSNLKIKLILCNGNEIIVNNSNYSDYAILSKRSKTYHLITDNNSNGTSKPIQIKRINKIN